MAARPDLKSRRGRKTIALLKAHEDFLKIVVPLVDTITFDLVMKGEDVAIQDQKAITRLLEHDVGLLRALSEIQAQGNLVAGLLVSAGNRVSCPVAGTVHRRARFDRSAPEIAFLVPLQERFIAAPASIERLLTTIQEITRRGRRARGHS